METTKSELKGGGFIRTFRTGDVSVSVIFHNFEMNSENEFVNQNLKSTQWEVRVRNYKNDTYERAHGATRSEAFKMVREYLKESEN